MRLAVMQQDRLSFVETLTGVHQGGLPLEGWTPLAVSPDGGSVVVFKSGILRVLSTAGPHEIWRKELYDQNQLANPPLRDPGIAFSDNGARIFVHVYGTGAVTKWDAISGQQTDSFQTGSERAWTWDANGDPVISANGEWIASAADNRSLRVINTATREALLIHDFPGSVCGVAFSPDGAKLAIAYDREKTAVEDSSDGRSHPAQYGVRFWDLETRRWLEQSVEGLPDPPCHLAFSQDGARMAIATSPDHDDEPSQVFLFDFAPSLWAKAALGRLRFKSEATDLPVQPGRGARH
jgi:WD40 repeat protein